MEIKCLNGLEIKPILNDEFYAPRLAEGLETLHVKIKKYQRRFAIRKEILLME